MRCIWDPSTSQGLKHRYLGYQSSLDEEYEKRRLLTLTRSDTNQKLRLTIVPFTVESLLHRERGISSLAGFVATEVKVFGESSEILAFLFMEKVRCTAFC